VEVVRSRVVDDLDVRIVQQRLVAAIGPLDPERIGLLARRGVAAAGNREHVDVPAAAQRGDVMGPDESRPDNPHSDTLHDVSPVAAMPDVITRPTFRSGAKCYRSRARRWV